MKNILVGLLVVLFIGIGIFLGKVIFPPSSPPEWSDSVIKKVNKHGLVEFTRSWSKTIEDDVGIGKGIIEYKWHFTYLIGIDVPNNWNWNIQRSDKEIIVFAPKLSLLNEIQFAIDSEHEFNEAHGNRQQRMKEAVRSIGVDSINKGVVSALKKDSQIYEHARLSLESFLLNLLNQANPRNASSKLSVIFK